MSGARAGTPRWRHSAARSLACMLGLAGLGWTASAAAAAADHFVSRADHATDGATVTPPPPDTLVQQPVRQVEVVLGCFNGSLGGQYVRLILTPDVRLDASFEMRIFDGSHVLLGKVTGLFGSAIGQHTPPGRGWLVAGPALALADARLPAALDPDEGYVEVVWARDGIERVPFTVHYGHADHSAPFPGYGVTLTPVTHSSIFQLPVPVTYAGDLETVVGCYASSPDMSAYRVTELFLGCSNGDHAASYVLVSGATGGGIPSGRVGLRMRRGDGTVQAVMLPVFPDTTLRVPGLEDRTLLLAGDAFQSVTGLAPDRLLPAPLDTSGTLELFYPDAIFGDVILTRVPYSASSPGPGRALVVAGNGALFQRNGPRASRLDGAAARFPADCRSEDPSQPMVLGQMVLGCVDRSTLGQFLRLDPSPTNDVLQHGFALRILDHSGAVLGESPDVFGAHDGAFAAPAHSLLLAASVPGEATPDGLLPAGLDTLGGAIVLIDRTSGADHEAWRQTYTRSPPLDAPFGLAFKPRSASDWQPVAALRRNWDGVSSSNISCHLGQALPRVAVRQVLGACGDGNTGQSFVELTSLADTPLDPRLGLRISAQGRTQDFYPLFQNVQSFQVWPSGRRFLIGMDSLAVLDGVGPNLPLVYALGESPAHIELYTRSTLGGDRAVIDMVDADFIRTPAPGRSLLPLAPPGPGRSSSSPDPERWDGSRPTIEAACANQRGLDDAVTLNKVTLQCANGNTRVQYVQIDRTATLAGMPQGLKLRVRDHSGIVLGERDSLFTNTPGPFWGNASSIVVGGDQFESQFGLAPDATLPATMDTLGGTLQLELPVPGGERLLSELRYGIGGVATPRPGAALVFEDGFWRADTLTLPVGFHGIGNASAGCVSRCQRQGYQLSLGGPQTSDAARAAFAETGNIIAYDVPRGEFNVSSLAGSARLQMGDAYALEGMVAPVETLGVTVVFVEHHADTCFRFCTSSKRRLLLMVDGAIVDSLALITHGSGTLSHRVSFERERPTRIEVFVAAQGQSIPPLEASVTGQIKIEIPPPGQRMVSCSGYDSDHERVVAGATTRVDMRSVSVAWTVYADPGFTADVQRLDESDPLQVWETVDTRPLEPSGLIRFLDRHVETLHAYRYRLSWFDVVGSHVSDEVRVEVPRSFGFYLFGAAPNPTRGAITATFELPEASDAQLELYDLLGRRVREVHRAFAAGPQQVAIERAVRLPPGLYVLRLRAEGREARRTVIVLP